MVTKVVKTNIEAASGMSLEDAVSEWAEEVFWGEGISVEVRDSERCVFDEDDDARWYFDVELTLSGTSEKLEQIPSEASIVSIDVPVGAGGDVEKAVVNAVRRAYTSPVHVTILYRPDAEKYVCPAAGECGCFEDEECSAIHIYFDVWVALTPLKQGRVEEQPGS